LVFDEARNCVLLPDEFTLICYPGFWLKLSKGVLAFFF
jgi:hypothetical protein